MRKQERDRGHLVVPHGEYDQRDRAVREAGEAIDALMSMMLRLPRGVRARGGAKPRVFLVDDHRGILEDVGNAGR